MSTPPPRVPLGKVVPVKLPGLPWCAEPGNNPNSWDEETIDPARVVEARAGSADKDAHTAMRRNRAAGLCAPCDPAVRAACLAAGVEEVLAHNPDEQWTGGIWGGQIHEDLADIAGLVKKSARKKSA